MEALSGPSVSVRDMLVKLLEMPSRMLTDDAPVIVSNAVRDGLLVNLFGEGLEHEFTNGAKLDALERVAAHIKHLAGASHDTRHKRAVLRLRDWAAAVDLPMPETPSIQ